MKTARVHHAARRRGGGVAACGAGAAAERMRRIGVLGMHQPRRSGIAGTCRPFCKGSQEAGWIDRPATLRIDYRWAEGRCRPLPGLRRNWSRSAPDVILAIGARLWRSLQQATTHDFPIVFVNVIDPVGAVCRQPGAAGRQRHRLLLSRLRA